jgi:hypothetical protein
MQKFLACQPLLESPKKSPGPEPALGGRNFCLQKQQNYNMNRNVEALTFESL